MEGAKRRLESLDVLRGLDMFILIIVSAVCNGLERTGHCPWLEPVVKQLHHSEWAGFTLWDLLMPLFIFTAGAAIPFAFAKYREEGRSNARIYFRIGRRFIVLWMLGMASQGNLLNLVPSQMGFLCNTLQCIAVGYLVSAVLYLNTRPRTQMIVAGGLLFVYWALMTFVCIDGFGGGDFSREHNLALYIGCRIGEVSGLNSISEWYLGLLPITAIAMCGMFSGEIIRKEGVTGERKALSMSVCGTLMIAAALLLSIQMPLVKHLWTSSFALLTSGISFVMFAGLYYCIDVRGWSRGWKFLLPFGMNAILAYMIRSLVLLNHHNPSEVVLYGLQNYLAPEWYTCVISIADKLLLWWLLYFLYKRKIFVRV